MRMNQELKLLAEWFWTDRWMGSSAFLLPLEPRGLYREMLTQAWRRGGYLPSSHDAIRRAVAASVEEWDRCWPLVSPYWQATGDGRIFNQTQIEVIGAALQRRAAKSASGAAGGTERMRRLRAARERGTHTAAEWNALMDACGHACVRCGADGERLHKDHITPLYREDLYPSDGVENLQPLCARCNQSKGPEIKDLRPASWHDQVAIAVANTVANTKPPSPSPSPSQTPDPEGCAQARPATAPQAAPPAPSESAKPKRIRKPPADPDAQSKHAECIDRFCAVMEAEAGKPYPFAGGRDGAAVKTLIRMPDYSPAEMERRLRLMLGSQFWAESGVDLPKFVKQWAALSNAGRPGSRGRKDESNTDRMLREYEALGGRFVEPLPELKQ
jgi:uncharacterized protein YdaU (DUF1376 family)